MKSRDSIRNEKCLLEALRAAETAALALRDYAASVLPPGPPAAGGPSIGEAAPAMVELLEGGWLAVILEAVLPHRGDGDRGRFLAHSLRAAIRQAFPDRLPPKFHICVLAYEHIYGPGRRFLDHDNMELKHCQDVLEAAFLTTTPPPSALPFSAAAGENGTPPASGSCPPRRSPGGWRPIGSPGPDHRKPETIEEK